MSTGVRGAGTPRGREIVERLLGPASSEPRVSAERFPDGAHVRVEIPSVENPTALRAVLEEAERWGIVIHRVSQGSGAMLLSESELDEMAALGAENGLEVNLFTGPREEFGVLGAVRGPDGPNLAGRLRGRHQLRYAIEDVLRAAEHGIRGFLIPDLGMLEVVVDMVAQGELPANSVFKASAVLAPSNAVSFAQLARLGASTINVPSDVDLVDLSEMRAAAATPIDLYLEAPDALGGMVRGHEIAEITLAAAPLYAKFGLRNARAVYPAGHQVMGDVVNNVREKVRRAAIALEWLERSGVDVVMSKPGAEGIGVPEP